MRFLSYSAWPAATPNFGETLDQRAFRDHQELMVTMDQKEHQVHEDKRDDEDQTEPRDQSEMLESQDHEDLVPPPKLR